MPPANRSVVAVAYDGLCAFEYGIACELFGLARPELDVEWYDFGVVSVDPAPLQLLGGVTLSADRDLDRIATAGTVVLPGWKDTELPPDTEVIDALIEAHDRGARIMTICSGVFALAATGLLDGRQATTHWRYVDQLHARFPMIDVVADVLFVDDDQLLTSAGSAAGIDLGLHLIRRDHGATIANAVARRLVLPAVRDGGQAQFIARREPVIAAGPLAVAKAWALDHLDEPLPVAMLAAQAGVSERTFARRFRAEEGITPHRWLTQQRVRAAQTLLESTDTSIDVVAQHCGFGSPATLRHHFAQQLQTTPTAYRRAFRAGV